MDLLNFGSLNRDIVFRVPEIVREGETLSSTQQQEFAGGKGFNQTVALKRAGVEVYHAGRIGPDAGLLEEVLDREGIPRDFIGISDQSTGQAFIQLNPRGENAIVLNPGANHSIDSAFIEEVFKGVSGQPILLLQNEISGIDLLLEKASRRKMPVYFNTAPFHKEILDYPLDLVDTFFVNQIEFTQLTGCDSLEEGLRSFRDLFPRSSLVITLGSEGALAMQGDRQIRCPAFPADPVDTTGAGDTFIGYYLAALIKGFSTEQALSTANRAASLSIEKEGAADSIPRWNRVVKA